MPAMPNPFEQMELKQSTFTATDAQVCRIVRNNVDTVLRASSISLAEEFDISQPALTRFCKKLGYRGFTDFKSALYQFQKTATTDEGPADAIEGYCQVLKRIPAALDDADMRELAHELASARAVFCTGSHKSSLPARLLMYNLQKLGIAAQFCLEEQLVTAPQMLGPDDSLVVFSAQGKTYRITLEAIRESNAHGAPRITLVTANAKAPARKTADRTIWLPNYQNQRMDLYLETQVSFMVFVDLLTNMLAQSK